jgi:hypothetical protein
LNTIPIELIALKNNLIEGMVSYMEADDEGFDAGYTKEDIDKCEAILNHYFTTVLSSSSHGDTKKIMATVEATVISLNVLNENCNYCIIETDQREGICELIINTAAQAGLETEEYDITEQWREW